jgi:hypothetical protein
MNASRGTNICSVSGCGRKVRALGLCDSHYQRRRRGQPVAVPLRTYGAAACSMAGCNRPHTANGLCHHHWRQQRKPPRWRRRTPAEVQAMRELHSHGVSFEELARRFGCSASTAARICKGWSFRDGTGNTELPARETGG